MSEKVRKFPIGYILIAIILLLVGVAFVAFSDADMLSTLALVIGIIVAVFGIVFGALTLANYDRGVKFVFRIIIAASCIIAGFVAIIVRDSVVSAIVNVVCILLLVDGSFKLQTAILSHRYRVAGWWIMLTLSVTVIITAFLMTKYGFEDKSLTSIFLGLIVMADGILNFISAFFCYANETRFFREAEPATKYKVVKIEDGEATATEATDAPATEKTEALPDANPAADAKNAPEATTEDNTEEKPRAAKSSRKKTNKE